MSGEYQRQILAALSATVPAHKRMELVERLGEADRALDAKVIENILVEVLRNDPNPIVRHEAAFSLGRLCSNGNAPEPQTIYALCEAARIDRSNVVRHEAAESLGNFAHPGVRRLLQVLLDDPDEDVVETARISLAWLAEKGEKSRAVQQVYRSG